MLILFCNVGEHFQPVMDGLENETSSNVSEIQLPTRPFELLFWKVKKRDMILIQEN